jgi:hypothetical protein
VFIEVGLCIHHGSLPTNRSTLNYEINPVLIDHKVKPCSKERLLSEMQKGYTLKV